MIKHNKKVPKQKQSALYQTGTVERTSLCCNLIIQINHHPSAWSQKEMIISYFSAYWIGRFQDFFDWSSIKQRLLGEGYRTTFTWQVSLISLVDGNEKNEEWKTVPWDFYHYSDTFKYLLGFEQSPTLLLLYFMCLYTVNWDDLSIDCAMTPFHPFKCIAFSHSST